MDTVCALGLAERQHSWIRRTVGDIGYDSVFGDDIDTRILGFRREWRRCVPDPHRYLLHSSSWGKQFPGRRCPAGRSS